MSQMKQFFMPNSMPRGDLSLEECALVASEISDGETSMKAFIDSLNRAEDTGQALEDVLVIAANSDEQDRSANAQLVQAISEMAVVGSDADPQQIISDTTLSIESLDDVKSHIKKLWDAIVLMLKQLWDQLKVSFGKYENFLESYKQRLTALRDQAKKLDPSKFDPKQTVSLGSCNRGGKAPKNGDQILENWDALKGATENILVTHLQNDNAVASVIADLLKESTSTLKRTVEPSLVTRDFSKHISEFFIKMTTMTKTSSEFTKAGGNDEHLSVGLTPPLPGGFRLTMKMRKEQVMSKLSSVQRLHAYLSSYVELEHHDDDHSKTVDVMLPRPEVLVKILDEAIDTIGIALGYLNSGQGKIASAQKQIETATTQLVDTLEKVEVPQSAHSYVQTFLRFNKHFATTTASTGNGMLKVLRLQLAATEHFSKKCLTSYLHMV